jgi:hypothetical protein
MLEVVLGSLFRKPATMRYLFEKFRMPKDFRGQPKFHSEKCTGCRLCIRAPRAGHYDQQDRGEEIRGVDRPSAAASTARSAPRPARGRSSTSPPISSSRSSNGES